MLFNRPQRREVFKQRRLAEEFIIPTKERSFIAAFNLRHAVNPNFAEREGNFISGGVAVVGDLNFPAVDGAGERVFNGGDFLIPCLILRREGIENFARVLFLERVVVSRHYFAINFIGDIRQSADGFFAGAFKIAQLIFVGADKADAFADFFAQNFADCLQTRLRRLQKQIICRHNYSSLL